MIFFNDAIFADKPDLGIFRYKKKDNKIVNNEDLYDDIKMRVLKSMW